MHKRLNTNPEVKPTTEPPSNRSSPGSQSTEVNTRVTSEYSNASQSQKKTSVLLQIIPVTLHGANGQLDTYALLDTGSTCTLVRSSVVNKLGLYGSYERIVLNGVQSKTELDSQRVDMQINGVSMPTRSYGITALVVNHLNVPQREVDLYRVKSEWPHLKDLNLQETNGCEVSLLIGSDSLDIILPGETRIGPKGSPVGILTKLRWTVSDPLPAYVRDTRGSFMLSLCQPTNSYTTM